jgi:hypothetical protein
MGESNLGATKEFTPDAGLHADTAEKLSGVTLAKSSTPSDH